MHEQAVTTYIETRNPSGILGGLSLCVVEVGWYGDNSLLDVLSQVGLGCGLHLHQNKGSDFTRGVILAVGPDPRITVAVAHNVTGNVLHLLLHERVVKAATDQAL